MIETYIAAATSYVDGEYGFLGRALVTQTWELVINTFPTHEIKMPLPPLQSVTSVKYDDGEGVEQTLSTSLYTVDTASEPGWIVPPIGTGWPTSIFDGINSVKSDLLRDMKLRAIHQKIYARIFLERSSKPCCCISDNGINNVRMW